MHLSKIIFGISILLPHLFHGQNLQLPAIDASGICEHISRLASDEFMGRKSGTIGEEKTTEYLQRVFHSAGLAPGNGNSYLQTVELAYFSSIAPARITFRSANGSTDLIKGEDYYLASTQLKEKIEITSAEIIFAGFGIHAPEIGWDDYAQLDVAGKIVIVLADTPDQYTRDNKLWKGDPAANIYGKTFYKREEAARRGAKGLFIVFREKGPGHFNWEMLQGIYSQPNLKMKKSGDIPSLDFSGYIRRPAVEKLLEAGRSAGFNFQEAALQTDFRGKSLALHCNFSFSNSWSDLRTHNVVGLLPGTERPEEVILYTAHWDHVGTGPAIAGDSIRNGAVDNASGTAALIEIARAYRQCPTPPKRSILFIATGAEELGLLGAAWYAAHPLFPIGKTVAAFNMDAHFPYGKTTHVLGVVYGRSELDQYLEESAAFQGRKIVPNTEGNITQDIFFRSDHFPLAAVGIPSEFAVGAGGPMTGDSLVWQQKMAAYAGKYHQPGDEYDADFDCGGIAQDAALIFRAGYRLSQNDHFPQWKSDQAFQRFRRESQERVSEQDKPAPVRVEELLEQHAKAMGGKEAWLNLKSWVVTQKRKDGQVIAYAKKPDKFRLDFQLKQRTVTKSYDGKTGWLVVNGEYEAMRPGEAIEMAEEPDFYGELIFAYDRGLPMKLVDPEKLNDHWCYRLQLTKSPTDTQWYWINPETFLVEQTAEYSEDSAHEGIFYKTIFLDYRSVDGLMFPREEGLIANDKPPRMWTLEKVELNKRLPNKFFRYRKSKR